MTDGVLALPVLAAWRFIDLLARLAVLSSRAGRAPFPERVLDRAAAENPVHAAA